MYDDSSNNIVSPEDTMSHEEFVRQNRNKLLKKYVPIGIVILAALIFVLIRAYGPDLDSYRECTECGEKHECREVKDALGEYKYYCDDCWEEIFGNK